jgi:hypothetical protein
LENLGVDVSLILKLDYRKWAGRMWDGLILKVVAGFFE